MTTPSSSTPTNDDGLGERTDSELEPRPWWAGTGEKILNTAVIIVAGLPVAHLTRNVYAAAVAGIVGLALFNAFYWKVVQGEKLTEVYNV